jgi:asparagine synthase (glutamine-hydrolysing)
MNLMLDSIDHRGPDQKVIFKNKIGTFGFVRLKIIDLSDNSNQPFVSFDGKVKVMYNGEIYNFNELREIYFPGKEFKSTGDGEILLHLYQKFGINFLEKIKGMFSISIIDENVNKVFLVRDRFGIKPLYFHICNNLFSFCSEITGIIKASKLNFSHNIKEIYKYFNQGLINATSETWFKNVYQVEAGYYYVFEKNSHPKKIKYYNIADSIDENIDSEKKSFKFYAKEFENRMLTSYEDHNNYDVKAGVHLSGGVDSAVLAGLTKKKGYNFNSYTFGFENKNYSEVQFAKKISDSANLKNKTSVLRECDVESYLSTVLQREYEPFSSLRVLSQHNLYDQYKQDCKVVIDGSGGDEVGAGYSYYLIPWYLDLLKSLNKDKLKKKFFKSLPFIKNNTVTSSNFIKGSFSQFRFPGSSTIDGSNYRNSEIFSKDFLNLNYKINIPSPFKSKLRNAQFADIFFLKLPRSLKYADRASMYNSMETRVPFLDHKIVEWSLQVPSKFKLLQNQQRILMKHPFKDIIDKKVLYLNKRTIADPQSIWLKTIFKDLFLDIINSSDFNGHGIFNKKKLRKYFDNFSKDVRHSNSFLVFQILISEMWFKKILKIN